MVWIAGVTVMTSKTASRFPSTVGTRRWDTTALSTAESWMRIWACCSAGKESTMRSMVFAAPMVCREDNSRWPVSAAVIAVVMVSRSRISPSMTTSGACRRAARSAREKVAASFGTSRWLTRDCLWLWIYSMGSSMVTMCACRVSLIRSTTQASVVLLPLPAGPVTRTIPLRSFASSITTSGIPSFVASGRSKVTTRQVAAMVPRWR